MIFGFSGSIFISGGDVPLGRLKPRLAKLAADRSEMLDEQPDEGRAMKVSIPNQSGAARTIRADRDEARLYGPHRGKTEHR